MFGVIISIFAFVNVLLYLHKIIEDCVIYTIVGKFYSLIVNFEGQDSTANSDKERNLLRNIFTGRIQSKMLQWILESLESLNCSKETKKWQNTEYQTIKL